MTRYLYFVAGALAALVLSASISAQTSTFVDYATGGGGGDLVDDTTPQLGGGLDTNGNDITFAAGDQLLIDDGAVGAPAIAFADDTDTGFWSDSNGRIVFNVNNTPSWKITATNLTVGSGITLGWGSAASVQAGSVDVQLSRGAANRLDLASGDDLQLNNLSGGDGSSHVCVDANGLLFSQEAAC